MAKKDKKHKKKSKGEKTSKKETEKVCETFEIGKSGKDEGSEEEVKTVCGNLEKKQAGKGEIKRYNVILKNVLIVLGILLILFFIGMYVVNSAKYFDYRGLTGEMVQEGENLFFYKIAFPVWYGKNKVPYNIYLRNNPEKLGENIPFILNEGEKINFGGRFPDDMYRLVLNSTSEAALGSCEGDKKGDLTISIANLVNIKAIGITVVADPNITSCDFEGEGRYMYVNIRPAQEGEISEVRQIGPACYDLVVKDCEVLKVTERLMVEAFVKHAEKVKPLE